MTPFTLVMAYYDNPRMLREHFGAWKRLPRDIAANIHVVIVDDGSPRWPAREAVEIGAPIAAFAGLASFQLWRMGVDVPWNQDACRNIGVREALTGWVLLTDMDHVVPADTWRALMTAKLHKKTAYRFARVTAPEMQPYKYHPNTWALSKALYWKVGGYDEALAGNYGTDGDFLVRLRKSAKILDLPQHVIRYPRELIADASTTTLVRKRPEEKDEIRRITAARYTVADWRPLHFSFPCERVL